VNNENLSATQHGTESRQDVAGNPKQIIKSKKKENQEKYFAVCPLKASGAVHKSHPRIENNHGTLSTKLWERIERTERTR